MVRFTSRKTKEGSPQPTVVEQPGHGKSKFRGARTGLRITLSILAAVAFALGHHLYYLSLTDPGARSDDDDLDVTVSVLDVQVTWDHRDWALRVGLTFAILVILSLLIAFRSAYHQYISFLLLRRPLPLKTASGLLSISHNPLGLNVHTPFAFPVLLAWALGILLFVTPFTLTEAPSSSSMQETQYEDFVPTLEFGKNTQYEDEPNTASYPAAFYVVDTASYAEDDKAQLACRNLTDPNNPFITCDNIPGGKGRSPKKILGGGIYGGPATPILRAALSSAYTGQIATNLWVSPNMAYSLNVTGPAVKCTKAPASVYNDLKSSSNFNGLAYYAWVPEPGSSIVVNLVPGAEPETLDHLSTDHARLYIALPRDPPTVLECGLFNATYEVDFEFKSWIYMDTSEEKTYGDYTGYVDQLATNQSRTIIKNVKFLNGVAYLNDTVQSERANENMTFSDALVQESKKSYLAYMQSLGTLFAGSITWSNSSSNNTADGYSSSILHTTIMNTNLAPGLGLDGSVYATGNMAEMIETLAQNITMSLFHSPQFTRLIPSQLTLFTPPPSLFYNPTPLWIAYATAIGLVTLFSLLGLLCAAKNGAEFHPSFLSYMQSATQLERQMASSPGGLQAASVELRCVDFAPTDGEGVGGTGAGASTTPQRRLVFVFEDLMGHEVEEVEAWRTPPETPSGFRRGETPGGWRRGETPSGIRRGETPGG